MHYQPEIPAISKMPPPSYAEAMGYATPSAATAAASPIPHQQQQQQQPPYPTYGGHIPGQPLPDFHQPPCNPTYDAANSQNTTHQHHLIIVNENRKKYLCCQKKFVITFFCIFLTLYVLKVIISRTLS